MAWAREHDRQHAKVPRLRGKDNLVQSSKLLDVVLLR